MRMLGDTMVVSRGETFVFNKRVTNLDEVPYILSSDIANPYILITITSNAFDIKGRWFKNYWLDLKDYPTFSVLEPVFIESLDNPPEILDAVYYTMDEFRTKKYFMWKNNEYVPYKFAFKKLFINKDTREWVESNYIYQVNLVGGNKTLQWLQGVFSGLYPDVTIPSDIVTLKTQICKLRHDLIDNIDFEAPLINFYNKNIFLKPSKLIVESNI